MFTGIFSKDYHEQQVKDPECLSSYFIGGVGSAMLSNRISHFYDLQGASMSIDTGCSAGLVALHQACQSIRSGASDVSIIGAASTMLHQDSFIAMSSMRYALPSPFSDTTNHHLVRWAPRASALLGTRELKATAAAKALPHLSSSPFPPHCVTEIASTQWFERAG